MKKTTFAVILFTLAVAFGALAVRAQVMLEPFVNTKPASTSTNVTIDATVTPCSVVASTSVSTLTCSLGTVPAADTVLCTTEFGDQGPSMQFTDNVNSGAYTVGQYGVTEQGGYHEFLGYWYFPNTSAGSTTVTSTMTNASNSWGYVCGAIKGTRTTLVLDPNFSFWNDNGTASTAISGPSSLTPTNNGELVLCVADLGVPSVTVTPGTNYSLLGSATLDALWPYYWGQTTKTSTNCPATAASSQVWTIVAGAFLPSSAPAGITPYQGFIANFGGLTNGSAPTPELLTGIANVSGSNGNGWFGNEADWYCCSSGSSTTGAVWNITNTNSDLTGSTSGPTGILSSTLYLPNTFNTSGGAGVSAFYTTNGNQTMNLKKATGTAGDAVYVTIAPNQSTFNYGGYIYWDIPNTDTSGHSYIFFGPITTGTDYLMLKLAGNGTTMTASMTNAFGSTTLGTVSASTDGLWVTGQFVEGGTDTMAIYTGCPTIASPSNTCSQLYSATLSDSGNSTLVKQLTLGDKSGTTETSGHSIYFRNVKMCSSYPCLP